MRGLAVSYKGMEDITELEIKELLDTKTQKKESYIIFDADFDQLAKLCYKAQSVNRVLLLLDSFKIKKVSDLKRVKDIDFSEYLKDKSFAVRTKIIHNDFNKSEVEKTTGDQIQGKVNLKNPDILVFIYIYNNDCYVGIDLGGDLSKRDYKIFTHRYDLKGTIAYAMIRISGFKKKDFFLDPLCTNGVVAVEASLFASGLSLNFHEKQKFPFLKIKDINLEKFDSKVEKTNIFAFDDQLRNIKSAQKNALIAGVIINFSKAEVEWLDTKFKKEEIKFIVSNAPRITKYNKKYVSDLFKEFFHQASFVLAKDGVIVLATNKTDLIIDLAKQQGFVVNEERDIEHGQEVLKIVTFKKP